MVSLTARVGCRVALLCGAQLVPAAPGVQYCEFSHNYLIIKSSKCSSGKQNLHLKSKMKGNISGYSDPQITRLWNLFEHISRSATANCSICNCQYIKGSLDLPYVGVFAPCSILGFSFLFLFLMKECWAVWVLIKRTVQIRVKVQHSVIHILKLNSSLHLGVNIDFFPHIYKEFLSYL